MLGKALAGGAEAVELTDEEKAQWVAAGKSVWADVVGGMRGNPQGFIDIINEKRANCHQGA